jgi:hypothetical protein
LLTVEQSNLLAEGVLEMLTVEMGVDNDNALDYVFADSQLQYGSEPSVLLPASFLRHENEYELYALVTNGELRQYETLKFTPNQCRWYEVVDSDTMSGYKEIA